MTEYIKKEDIEQKIQDGLNNLVLGHDAIEVLGMIYEIPAADVAPAARCKDCKHKGWVQEPCHGKSVDYCKIWDCTLRNLEATFCSYGEQKDGGASDVRIAD